jgi:hypothetical protein
VERVLFGLRCETEATGQAAAEDRVSSGEAETARGELPGQSLDRTASRRKILCTFGFSLTPDGTSALEGIPSGAGFTLPDH